MTIFGWIALAFVAALLSFVILEGKQLETRNPKSDLTTCHPER
jgi:hypothetical protein